MDTQYYTEHVSVDSSAMVGLTYDADTKRLFVHFHSGNKAGYEGVSQSTFNEFKNATSKGAFYAKYIKPRYKGINSDVTFAVRKANLAGVYVETPKVQETVNKRKYAVTVVFEAASVIEAAEEFGDYSVREVFEVVDRR